MTDMRLSVADYANDELLKAFRGVCDVPAKVLVAVHEHFRDGNEITLAPESSVKMFIDATGLRYPQAKDLVRPLSFLLSRFLTKETSGSGVDVAGELAALATAADCVSQYESLKEALVPLLTPDPVAFLSSMRDLAAASVLPSLSEMEVSTDLRSVSNPARELIGFTPVVLVRMAFTRGGKDEPEDFAIFQMSEDALDVAIEALTAQKKAMSSLQQYAEMLEDRLKSGVSKGGD